jgi:hypothetical protein
MIRSAAFALVLLLAGPASAATVVSVGGGDTMHFKNWAIIAKVMMPSIGV